MKNVPKLSILSLCSLAAGGALSLQAAPIAGVDFENADGSAIDRSPDDLDAADGITVSADWTVSGTAIEVQTNDPNSSGSATSGLFAAKLNGGSVVADLPLTAPEDHSFSWTITIPANVSLDLDNITFNLRQGTGTDTNTRWAIFNTSLDDGPGGSYTWSIADPVVRPDWENVDVDLSGTVYQGLTGTTVTLYWYCENSGCDIDSIVLNGTATTLVVDSTPPAPSPMTWESVPSAEGFGAITMTATTATDPNGVEYYFTETSGNAGGSDSGWQDSPSYTDGSLDTGTTYSYTVKARDKSAAFNETVESSEESATTESDSGQALYQIQSFNSDGSTGANSWLPGITTIVVANGLTGTTDDDLVALQSMNPDPINTSGASGNRFQNSAGGNGTRETVTTDVDVQGTGGPDGQPAGDGYFQFGITDGGAGGITLTTLSFDAVRATTSASVRGYDIDISVNEAEYVDLGAGNVANNRDDGLESFLLPITGVSGASSVDFRIRATGGGIEWTNFSVNGTSTAGPDLSIARNGSNLEFSWNSKEGFQYSLVSNTALDTAPVTWAVVGSNEDIPADMSGTNLLSMPAPSDPVRFYAVVEEKLPPTVVLSVDFEADNGGFTSVDESAGSGSIWEWGVPDSNNDFGSTVTEGNGGSTHAWGVNLGAATTPSTTNVGIYTDTTSTALRSPVVDLTTYTEGALSYAEALDVDSDSSVVNFLDADAANAILASVTVSDSDLDTSIWATRNIALPAAVVGKNVIVEWRFTGVVDGFIGWYIDDVSVEAR